jgi:hypothetical protein
MITAVVIADAAVDVVSTMSSHAAIVATPELLLEHRAQLHQLLLLLLEHSLKLLELLRLGPQLPAGGGMAALPVRCWCFLA